MKFSTTLCTIGIVFLATFLLCEFFVYYVVLSKCKWPDVGQDMKDSEPIPALLLADTHLLGPYHGHWWDKLRREWQMHRAFQAAVQLFHPEVVFFLGDLFDEGQWVDQNGFREYVLRFQKLFHTPAGVRTISAVGNHDIGFHYRLHPLLSERFDEAFNHSAVNLHTIRNVHFVTINSMAMENDGCYFCEGAKYKLRKIQSTLDCSKDESKCVIGTTTDRLRYSRPILLQHFPTYRKSDKRCIEGDIPALESYRENWEVLSKESTDFIGKTLNPRVVFSGHSHHYCRIKNRLKVEEYTISSFSWRNKNNPSFLLALFTPDNYAVSICYLPHETTVIKFYGSSVFLNFVILSVYLTRKRKQD
ncbi:unnamed protein product [Hermetia illucens]|uniref:Metallophosphoesterase 1 homolog n=1 Tax=Hermetia illucens TaxID=343691 RepID=A0A7R8YN40_HERIL|nr:metallophosphoesterase 1 homolog [Hermetia illucens]CAD7079158.1 unnamed protein product [Hermetia illucens]